VFCVIVVSVCVLSNVPEVIMCNSFVQYSMTFSSTMVSDLFQLMQFYM